MRTLSTIFAMSAALMIAGTAAAQSNHTPVKPTIVLIHGQTADPSSWSDLATNLTEGKHAASASSFDLRDITPRKDDVTVVAQSISAQLAPNGALVDYRLQSASRANGSAVRMAAVGR